MQTALHNLASLSLEKAEAELAELKRLAIIVSENAEGKVVVGMGALREFLERVGK